MSKVYKCSVIVPCHNVEAWIEPLINSLNTQTEKDFEIIFVLDSCTDGTEKVIKEKCKTYKIIKCDAHSCGLARNKGLEKASGKYIWFVDADDWIIHEQAIETLANTLDVREDVDVIKFRFKSNGFNITCDEMVWQYFYRRNIIGDITFRAEMPAEDGDFQTKVLFGRRVMHVDAPLYFYNYPREGSIMDRVRKGIDVNAECRREVL